MTSVSVIIPARNAAATLGATLDALAEQSVGPAEIVVVDDGSTDTTPAVVRNHEVVSKLIQHRHRQGPGAARNAGAAVATGSVLAFTDADCVPSRDWIAKGRSRIQAADLIQGRVEPLTPPGPFDRTVVVRTDRGLFETANLLIKPALFARLGGFEDFAGSGRRGFGEDALLGWRARRTGAEIRFAPDVVVRHVVFRGSPLTLFTERWRLRYFPALVRHVPELRRHLFARAFLTKRTASFDLAVAATALALSLRSPVPAVGTLPYTHALVSAAQRGGRLRSPAVGAVDAVGDVIALAALLSGSVRHRRLLL